MKAHDDVLVERREFLKRATIAAGTAPVIITVLANRADAMSCAVAGTVCGSNTTGECDPDGVTVCCNNCISLGTAPAICECN